MYPQADIFTLFYEPDRVSPLIRGHRVTASFLNPLRRFHRALLPAMPIALEHFDLRGYDLVISSESGPAKGVLVSAAARHVSYVHSPMRYLWELYPNHFNEWAGPAQRLAMGPIAGYLRQWDHNTAARVDTFIANSENTRRRIFRAWGRESLVVYPPVDVHSCFHRPAEDYLLMVGEFVRYKRMDHAVAACTRLGLRLKLVGNGPEYRRLRSLAGPTVEFCGRLNDAELRELFARCTAYLVPGEEDFGITTVEVIASGKPVIGLNRGGTPEIIGSAGPEGALYEDASAEALAATLKRFLRTATNSCQKDLQARARIFSAERFSDAVQDITEGRSLVTR